MSAEHYALTPRRFALSLGAGAALLGVALLVGCVVGLGSIDLWGAVTGTGPAADVNIFRIARLPRVLTAAGVGALLGLGGALFQGVLRNPLADPYVLGTAGGAALGTMLALSLGIAQAVPGGRLACSLLGAFVALACVMGAAARRGRVSVHTLILVGVVVNTFCGAAILLTVALLEPEPAHSAVLWMMGALGMPALGDACITAVALALALAIAWPFARRANLLAGGEESAAYLGVDVARTRWILLAVGGLCAGAAVGEAGPIGFIGLVVPHCVRRVAGADHRLLLPLSALGGAALLVLADIPSRSLGAQVLPVGVFTAMLGAPFFLWLLRRTDTGMWARA
jgi:iron complex transport system permease protein